MFKFMEKVIMLSTNIELAKCMAEQKKIERLEAFGPFHPECSGEFAYWQALLNEEKHWKEEYKRLSREMIMLKQYYLGA